MVSFRVRIRVRVPGTNRRQQFTVGSECGSKIIINKGKGSPYSITERRVPELIPVLGSQPAGDESYSRR